MGFQTNVNSFSDIFIKVAFDGILFPNPIWDIFGEVFYNCFRKVQMY